MNHSSTLCFSPDFGFHLVSVGSGPCGGKNEFFQKNREPSNEPIFVPCGGGAGVSSGCFQTVLLVLVYFLATATVWAQRISTVAGKGGQYYSGDAIAPTSAQLNKPNGMAIDSRGNLYFADQGNHRIRRLDPDGYLATVAGTGISGFNGDGIAATSAQLNNPVAVAVDAFGNLFIADRENQRIRKVNLQGVITTVAGTGTVGNGNSLNLPSGVTVDGNGNLYIADTFNQRICKVSPQGVMVTFVGNGSFGYSGDGGFALAAKLNMPTGVAIDKSDNLYISDQNNHCIRKVNPQGLISTVAGTGTAGYNGNGGAATMTQLNTPAGITVDGSGNLFIADQNNQRVRKVNPQGIISTVAGNGAVGYSGDGSTATSAQFRGPVGVAVDASGNLYIADQFNYCLRKVSAAGTISTFLGNGTIGYNGDSEYAVSAYLNLPAKVALDGSGNLYIADQANHRIRRLSTGGLISTVAGTGSPGFSGDGAAATLAQLNNPAAVAVDETGNLFIADKDNHRIRKVSPQGIITTVAGMGSLGGYSRDGFLATTSLLNEPNGVAVDRNGNFFIADQSNHRVRRVNKDGFIYTVIGDGTPGYTKESEFASQARLNSPSDVAVDNEGNLYIADQKNHRICMVNSLYKLVNIAGSGTAGYSGDGAPAASAQLNTPAGIAVDGFGNLFIADQNNERIRKVNPPGVITTVAGTGSIGNSGDGAAATSAQLNAPSGVAVDGSGNFFIADQYNGKIRKVTQNPTVSITPANLSALCAGSPVSLTATAANYTPTSFTWTSQPAGFSASGPTLASTIPAVSTPTDYTLTLKASDGQQTFSASLRLTVNPSPGVTLLTSSNLLTCTSPTANVSALVGASPAVTQFSFLGPGITSSSPTSGTALVNKAGSYSVVVSTASGCSAVATTSVGSDFGPVLSAGASLAMANVGVTISLTASGAASYQWQAPTTAPLTTQASSGTVSASLNTAGVQTFTVVGTTGVCSQSALVSVTALTGADLSPTITLPSSNFSAGETKILLVQVQEVNGTTATGAIVIRVTVPTGYTASFDNTMTSTTLTSGRVVQLRNSQWHISGDVTGLPLRLVLNDGQSVLANSTMNLGISITRTNANSGSVSSITVNVVDDSSGSYDVNRLNNVYARIITGL